MAFDSSARILRLDHVLPLFGLAILAAIGYQILQWIYNVLFHPLRKFPGPTKAAMSPFPYVRQQLKGNLQQWIVELHEEYGDVVRVTPNQLSFTNAASWKDIYTRKPGGGPIMAKWSGFYAHPGPEDGIHDIITSNDAGHTRMRRILSHAFSDRALKLQEQLFLTYTNRLIDKLREVIKETPDHTFNMVEMYNFTTFDIMGDLTFGEPLNLLNDTTYHPWIQNMFASFKFGAYLHSIRYYPLLEKTLMAMLPPSLHKKRKEHDTFSSARVDRRLEKKDARSDIWGLILAREEGTGLSKEEMYKNAGIFMIAGTETTATELSGLTYFLLKNPEKMKKLTEEIRTSFATDEDLTIERLQALPYLHACIEEGLRMFPPVSNGLPRVVPREGATVAGHVVPPGSIVSTHQLGSYRNPDNFKDPYSFIPERWISDDYASDKKHALNPFSTGPRNCIGKNMAYHEIRLILSKMLWHFDLELCPETGNFANTQKIYVLWEKGPLWCKLTAAPGRS